MMLSVCSDVVGSCGRHVVIGQLPGEWWVFIILGLCAGVIGGMLGLGSGTLMIPVLVLLFRFEQKSAQGTALAVMVPMTLVGAIRYWRNPDVELSGVVIILLALGAVAGTLVGTELAARLSAGTLRKLFAIFLVVVAARMFFVSPRPKEIRYEKDPGNPAGAEAIHRGHRDDAASQR
jgi:uncharacterized membrane protein YfcA